MPDIAGSGGQWPDFSAAALGQGFHSVHATPMKLRREVIGTMNLFLAATGALNDRDEAVVRAVLIEQAKGAMAESLNLTMDQAFTALRSYARNHNLTLNEVSSMLTTRRLSTPGPSSTRHRPRRPDPTTSVGSARNQVDPMNRLRRRWACCEAC
ncbi:MAG: ANTAR domain-containing protein [Pseudolysinimonas sp.]